MTNMVVLIHSLEGMSRLKWPLSKRSEGWGMESSSRWRLFTLLRALPVFVAFSCKASYQHPRAADSEQIRVVKTTGRVLSGISINACRKNRDDSHLARRHPKAKHRKAELLACV